MASKEASTGNLFAVLALYEQGSYGAAADAIGRDSGTVRYHLMVTRAVYGDDLLVYDHGRWQTTTTGLKVLELARQARALHADLRGVDATTPLSDTAEGAA
jgi:DNA-binding transcriptional LysR family regulator